MAHIPGLHLAPWPVKGFEILPRFFALPEEKKHIFYQKCLLFWALFSIQLSLLLLKETLNIKYIITKIHNKVKLLKQTMRRKKSKNISFLSKTLKKKN